jgi:MFS family permease
MIAIPFMAFISLFTVISSLINQILGPYSFSQSEAGIGGGLLIIVGLAFAAIVSPIVDRTKAYLFTIKLLAPIISACYLAFIWAPQSRSLAFVYVILAIQGAASFSLLPIALELLIEITHPVSPEVTSTISWSLGQLFGGIGVLIGNDLRDPGIGDGSADNGTSRPPGNMHRTLLSMAICSLVIIPLPLALGCFGRGNKVRLRRLNTDRGAREATIRA